MSHICDISPLRVFKVTSIQMQSNIIGRTLLNQSPIPATSTAGPEIFYGSAGTGYRPICTCDPSMYISSAENVLVGCTSFLAKLQTERARRQLCRADNNRDHTP